MKNQFKKKYIRMAQNMREKLLMIKEKDEG